MKPEFSFLQALVMSFYSRKLYKEVYYKWQNSGLFYALKLAISLSILMVIMALFLLSKMNLDQEIRSFSQWLVGRSASSKETAINRAFTLTSTLPHLSYTNNTLSTEVTEHYVINDPETKNALLTINTTDTPISIPPRHNRPYFTLTAKYLAINDHHIGYTDVFSESNMQDFLHVLNHFPEIQLAQDRLVHTGTDPLLLTGQTTKDPLVIIDTTNIPTSLDKHPSAVLLLAADSISFKDPFSFSHSIITKRWAEISHEELYEGLKHGASLFKYGLGFMIVLVMPIITFVIFMFLTTIIFLYSMLAYLYTHYIAKVAADSFTLHHCIKLCSVALTPIFILCLCVPPVRLSLLFIYIILGIVYTHYAIFSVLQSKDTSN